MRGDKMLSDATTNILKEISWLIGLFGIIWGAYSHHIKSKKDKEISAMQAKFEEMTNKYLLGLDGRIKAQDELDKKYLEAINEMRNENKDLNKITREDFHALRNRMEAFRLEVLELITHELQEIRKPSNKKCK